MAEGKPSASTVFEVVNFHSTFKELVTLWNDCIEVSRK